VTLFLTDIWERFSFYGMQAILVLYAAAPADRGGLGLPPSTAAGLFGVYMATVFMLAIPGGWLGDRVLGERRAMLWGAVVIALGHYCLAVPGAAFSAVGLAGIALGTGLLKPNMGALLAKFYGPGQATEREAAFSIFYMSIQVSALLGPIVVGFLGETLDWHLGFAAAGVGMTFGVLQLVRGQRHFGTVGDRPGAPATSAERRAALRTAARLGAVAALLVAGDVMSGGFAVEHVIVGLGVCLLVVPWLYFRWLVGQPGLSAGDRARLRALLWLLLAAAVFWMVVSQAGSLLNLFARDSTTRALLGITLPAAWFQSATPLFILVTAPGVAWLWLRLGARAGVPMKFTIGLLLAGSSFLVMAVAAGLAAAGDHVASTWLLSVFFLQALGEVVLAPVGISTAAAAAPAAFAARTVSLWWLFSAFGVGLGSQLIRLASVLPPQAYYLALGLAALATGAAVTLGRGGIARALGSGERGPGPG
jgi:proton-dependent oligopeptide transporter, POT family